MVDRLEIGKRPEIAELDKAPHIMEQTRRLDAQDILRGRIPVRRAISRALAATRRECRDFTCNRGCNRPSSSRKPAPYPLNQF